MLKIEDLIILLLSCLQQLHLKKILIIKANLLKYFF